VIVWRWDSDPFGTTAASQDPDGDSVNFVYHPRFPGQYYDAETGLNHNYFRDYDPQTGKYVESDPIGLTVGMNTFAYIDSSPIDSYDVFGLQARAIREPPARVARHNSYTDPWRQAQREFGRSEDNSFIPPVPKPSCRLICDSENTCNAVPANAIRSNMFPGCFEICATGPTIGPPERQSPPILAEKPRDWLPELMKWVYLARQILNK